MQSDIPQYSVKVMTPATELKRLSLSETHQETGPVTHIYHLAVQRTFRTHGSPIFMSFWFHVIQITNEQQCVWEGDGEKKGTMWCWGYLRPNWKEKNCFIIMIFHFPIYFKKKFTIVRNVSHFCKITISPQIRNLTDDRLLQKQYVPESVFLSL